VKTVPTFPAISVIAVTVITFVASSILAVGVKVPVHVIPPSLVVRAPSAQFSTVAVGVAATASEKTIVTVGVSPEITAVSSIVTEVIVGARVSIVTVLASVVAVAWVNALPARSVPSTVRAAAP
jgi:hypothetical protein